MAPRTGVAANSAAALGVSKDAVHRVWKEAGLKPHRLERYMASDDPDFEAKAAEIIGLYLNPPQHAAVFCVDEKTAIQALDRLDPVLPLSPGRAERHGFEYYRHGTLSLYAALDTATGRVHGKTAARHTSQDFVAFLKEVVTLCPTDSRSTSSSTISPLTRPRWCGSSWSRIPVALRQLVALGKQRAGKLAEGKRKISRKFEDLSDQFLERDFQDICQLNPGLLACAMRSQQLRIVFSLSTLAGATSMIRSPWSRM